MVLWLSKLPSRAHIHMAKASSPPKQYAVNHTAYLDQPVTRAVPQSASRYCLDHNRPKLLVKHSAMLREGER